MDYPAAENRDLRSRRSNQVNALIRTTSRPRKAIGGSWVAVIGAFAFSFWTCAPGEAAPSPPAIVWKASLHSRFVNAVAISPDGTLLASASGDTTVKLWRFSSGEAIRTLAGHWDLVNSVAFSPDGATLASGSADQTIKLWRVADGALLRTLYGHTEFVSSVAFSPDGSTLLSGGGDTSLRLWRVANGALLQTSFGHISTIWSLAISPDGALAASGSGSLLEAPGTGENTIKLWRLSDGVVVRTLQGHSADVWSVRFSPEGTLLASGSGDKTIKLWRVSDGAPVRTLAGHSAEVLSVAFTPDGLTLASGSRHPDNTLKFWRASDGATLLSYNQETYFINSIAFSPDGRWFGYGRDDNYVVAARNPFPPTGPPRIVLQPQDRSVACYDNTVLQVAAAGNAPLTFQWSLNGANLPDATNSSLALDNVRAPDAGAYRVAVSNALDAVISDPAVVTVLDTEPAVRLLVALRGGRVRVTWPQTCADYVLEENASVDPNANWNVVGPTAVLSDEFFSVDLPLNGTGRFLRLRKL